MDMEERKVQIKASGGNAAKKLKKDVFKNK